MPFLLNFIAHLKDWPAIQSFTFLHKKVLWSLATKERSMAPTTRHVQEW